MTRYSVNDGMMVDPVVQHDRVLFHVRFRLHQVGIVIVVVCIDVLNIHLLSRPSCRWFCGRSPHRNVLLTAELAQDEESCQRRAYGKTSTSTIFRPMSIFLMKANNSLERWSIWTINLDTHCACEIRTARRCSVVYNCICLINTRMTLGRQLPLWRFWVSSGVDRKLTIHIDGVPRH